MHYYAMVDSNEHIINFFTHTTFSLIIIARLPLWHFIPFTLSAYFIYWVKLPSHNMQALSIPIAGNYIVSLSYSAAGVHIPEKQLIVVSWLTLVALAHALSKSVHTHAGGFYQTLILHYGFSFTYIILIYIAADVPILITILLNTVGLAVSAVLHILLHDLVIYYNVDDVYLGIMPAIAIV